MAPATRTYAADLAPATDAGTQVLTTKYFNIFYPHGEEKAAAWYANFADDTDQAVSELLGSQPVSGLKLRIYATEAEYTAANPMAEIHSGIMAHAVPELKEVGVAVERLRQVAPELARESFRHEMTHIVAGELSDNKLPVGFQEGLAQYNELSSTRGQEVAQAMRTVLASGNTFLAWEEMNDQEAFGRNIEIGYPESYSVMSFLAGKYGMGDYGRFMQNLRGGNGFDDALAYGFGVPALQLEKQWRDYVPEFLKSGWQQNVLQSYDLAPAKALLSAGSYTDAQSMLEQSEHLYRDLGQTARADEAARLKQQAIDAQSAGDIASQARNALEQHDYARAMSLSTVGNQQYNGLQVGDSGSRMAETAKLASDGMTGLQALAAAHKYVDSWDLVKAEPAARQAGSLFAALGDDTRVAEANGILSQMWLLRRTVGLGILAFGTFAALLGGVAIVRNRGRIRRTVAVQPANREENGSWL